MPEFTSACWPGQGGVYDTKACCLSAEGGNPELDQCGWMVDADRQQWRLSPAGAPGAYLIVSALNDMCLTMNNNLEVYAGPLAGGNATAVLFNRTPATASIRLSFDSIPGQSW